MKVNNVRIFMSLLAFFYGVNLTAQKRQIVVKHIGENYIRVNGILSEDCWASALTADSFYQQFPYDTSRSVTQTKVMVLSDIKNIYIAAICYKYGKGNYVVSSLKRDFSYPINDAFSVHIDPFNDMQNGFAFSVSPYGVQREGLIQSGGTRGVTTDWDNKWISAVKQYDSFYVVEMAIPFKTLRYNFGNDFWHINFSRNNLVINENSTWNPVPRNMNIASLVKAGKLIWEKTPPKPKFNSAIIPYVFYNVDQPKSTDLKFNQNFKFGLDAKIVLTPSMNLDITINPDFAQVEVDRQVVNLTRFNLFFPERRNFFIENSDLFANFGFRQIRPFFSRNIGLINGNSIPIISGVRLSGKLNSEWRIGAMNTITKAIKIGSTNLNSEMFNVLAFQRNVFKSSNIAGIFVDRLNLETKKFNRVAGLDYNLQSKNGKWLGKVFYHHSFTSDSSNRKSMAHASWLVYTDKKWFLMWNHEYVDQTFNAQTGFVPRIENYDMKQAKLHRLSYWRFEPEISYKIFPKSHKINNINPLIYSDIYLNKDYSANDFLLKSGATINFQSSASVSLFHNFHQTVLLFYSDIFRNGKDTFLPEKYQYQDISINYTSNRRKVFNYVLTANHGQFFNHIKTTLKTDLAYRIQPFILFGLSGTYDRVILKPSNTIRDFYLIAPNFELTFTKQLFLTTFIQYNTQNSNTNFNIRFQYRYKPMSDIFLVYSDNYDLLWNGKQRALSFKWVYWFNS